jgi:hypothetical protein
MKFLAFAALLFSPLAYAGGNSGVSPLVGTYESGGYRFEVFPLGGSLGLRTRADLTKNPSCATRVSAPLGQRSAPGFAEVYYQLEKGRCPGIDGRVTLHYNRTIFGGDVYLLDVLLQKNTIPPNAHNWSNARSVRWSLRKKSGN